jgi:CheY-like chemotaxis protein
MKSYSLPITVLLAEDDPDDQELLAEAFSGIDPSIRMISFSSGKKILDYLERLQDREIPDLIILDYNIPEINGAVILQELEKHARYRPVIKLVWSTSSVSLYEDSCLALGARAYLVKPTNISGLADLARKMLDYVGRPLDPRA